MGRPQKVEVPRRNSAGAAPAGNPAGRRTADGRNHDAVSRGRGAALAIGSNDSTLTSSNTGSSLAPHRPGYLTFMRLGAVKVPSVIGLRVESN